MFSFKVTCVFDVLLVLLLLLLKEVAVVVVLVRVLFNWKRPNLMLLLMFCEQGISEVDVVVVDDIAVGGGDSLIELNLFSFDWKFNLLSIELWAVGEFVVCSKTGLEVDDDGEQEEAADVVDEDETVDDVEPVEDVDLEFKKLFKLVAFLVSEEEESVEWPIRLVLWLGGKEWRVLANIFLFLLLPKYFLVWLIWFVFSFEVVDCWHLADLIGLNVYLLLLLSDLNSSRDEVDDDDVVVVVVDVDDETVSLEKLLLRDFFSSLLTKLIFSTGANMPWLCLHWKYLEKK